MSDNRQRSCSAISMKRCLGFAGESSKRNQRSRRELIATLQSKVVMRARVFKLLYLTAIAVAMVGWVWMLVEGFTWTIN
jgi:hypothetical protein